MQRKGLLLIFMSLTVLAFQNCSQADFESAAGNGTLGKLAGTSGNSDGQIPADGDGDGAGSIPLSEFLEMLAGVPADAENVIEKNHCCISHGGGHGIDLCMSGDKAALLNLWPIEVRGNSICVPAETIAANPTLFAGATVGRCQR